MKDFLHRTITTDPVEYIDCDGDKVEMTVTRTRTSDGFNAITAKFGIQRIEFNSEFGDNYEEVAREFARMLETVTYASCSLPKTDS